MANFTNTQMEIIGIYAGVFLLSILIGILFAGKGKHGLGALIGINIGVSVIAGLWLGWGKDKWNSNTPTPTTSPPSVKK